MMISSNLFILYPPTKIFLVIQSLVKQLDQLSHTEVMLISLASESIYLFSFAIIYKLLLFVNSSLCCYHH